MSSRKVAIIAILLTILASSLIFSIYRLHYRVITTGSFDGIAIGLSKPSIFEALSSRDLLASIRPSVGEMSVDHSNAAQIQEFASVEAFMIQSPRFQIKVKTENGKIVSLSRFDDDSSLRGKWDDVSYFLEAVRRYLTDNTDASVIAIPVPRGPSDKGSVWLNGSKAEQTGDLAWLSKFDHWTYHVDGTFVFLDLFFKDGRLTRIEYRNNFGELP